MSEGDDFYRLSKALKEAGRTGMRKELHKGMRKAAVPLIALTRARARQILPREGGLAERVAKVPQRVAVRTGMNTAGVSLVAGTRKQGRSAAWTTNRGYVRHPVFGNRELWVEQQVPRGWFDDPIRAARPRIVTALERTMEDVVDAIVKEVR